MLSEVQTPCSWAAYVLTPALCRIMFFCKEFLLRINISPKILAENNSLAKLKFLPIILTLPIILKRYLVRIFTEKKYSKNILFTIWTSNFLVITCFK